MTPKYCDLCGERVEDLFSWDVKETRLWGCRMCITLLDNVAGKLGNSEELDMLILRMMK